MNILVAHIEPEEPARVWYLPLTGKEHVEYPTHEAASKAATRLCVVAGVPIVTPLSRKKES